MLGFSLHGSLPCFRSLCTRSVLPLLVCRPKRRSSKQYDLHGSHTTSYNLGSFSRIRFTSQHEVFVLALWWDLRRRTSRSDAKNQGWGILGDFKWYGGNSKDWGGTGNYTQPRHLLHHKRIQVPRWILPLHLSQVKPAINLIWRPRSLLV